VAAEFSKFLSTTAERVGKQRVGIQELKAFKSTSIDVTRPHETCPFDDQGLFHHTLENNFNLTYQTQS
jgi:hypothetical protein